MTEEKFINQKIQTRLMLKQLSYCGKHFSYYSKELNEPCSTYCNPDHLCPVCEVKNNGE